ncbi:hypothetical protein M409DRAFT_50118 [Zasmidium cellare ATCC 36951]|uniref:Zn(2)-C6 fungal-type domain-containing protein n=1 Tax=Zasmidium cellare ATCC 36951 TaxID=1080233 RepID=A0A6A6D434_ZASCE|nr:uncharacterized protein M409DRAFT_50118 [Zasmidium cellare ATCC 36951]KAF2172416.1 hypothetical protein M409DRAFT_50118 [Zasmidium cellare ATCC 36951]
MPEFRSYDLSQPLGRQLPKACEQCHVRKVRCIPNAEGEACQQCVKHGTECRPRIRKRRRARTSGNNDPSSEAIVSRHYPGATSASVSNEGGLDHRHGRRPPPLLFAESGTRGSTNSSPATSSTLDRFHNSSYLCRTAILGQDFQDIDHTHGSNADRRHALSSTDLQMLELYQAFDLPEQPERQSLIDACFERCWTCMPVVDRTTLVGTAESEISYVVLQSILLAGSLMRPNRYSSAVVETIYRRVKALLDCGHERNPLNVLAALCYIQWYPSQAPKDISLDSPRFWTTMAIGIAQQMGLHRKSLSPGPEEGLRRRLWWCLRTKDNLSASAHGRPRHVNPLDCTQPPLTLEDFPDPSDRRAHISISYVTIIDILGDLCQLMARNGDATLSEKNEIARRLLTYLDSLPEDQRLVAADGSAMPYDLDIAQLHIHILATISILYRSKSMFSLTSANAASIAAANLSFRIFEAIELREHTHCLSSAFAWYMLVTASPPLACLRLPELSVNAGLALDSLEISLETLARTRPSAKANLRNVRAIRKAMTSSSVPSIGREAENCVVGSEEGFSYLTMASTLLARYGYDAVRHYEELVQVLGPSHTITTLV